MGVLFVFRSHAFWAVCFIGIRRMFLCRSVCVFTFRTFLYLPFEHVQIYYIRVCSILTEHTDAQRGKEKSVYAMSVVTNKLVVLR